MIRCYIGLGSNLGESDLLLKKAVALFQTNPAIYHLECSQFYQTTPVNCLSTRPFINAVAAYDTTLSIEALFTFIEEVELSLGKSSKPKTSPRLIDIDLLFYGDLCYRSQKIIVPHPRWHTRLFVIRPLRDLTSSITLKQEGFSISINIEKMVSSLLLLKREEVKPYATCCC